MCPWNDTGSVSVPRNLSLRATTRYFYDIMCVFVCDRDALSFIPQANADRHVTWLAVWLIVAALFTICSSSSSSRAGGMAGGGGSGFH